MLPVLPAQLNLDYRVHIQDISFLANWKYSYFPVYITCITVHILLVAFTELYAKYAQWHARLTGLTILLATDGSAWAKVDWQKTGHNVNPNLLLSMLETFSPNRPWFKPFSYENQTKSAHFSRAC